MITTTFQVVRPGTVVRSWTVETLGGQIWYRVRIIMGRRKGRPRLRKEVLFFTGYRNPS